MIKTLSLPIGEPATRVTLRFDLGTTYLFNELTKDNPPSGPLKGYDEAIHMVHAAYLRALERAKSTEQPFTADDIREACKDLHASELKAYASAFSAVLITEPIPGLQEPEGGTPDEKNEK